MKFSEIDNRLEASQPYLAGIMAACRKFLERIGTDGREGIHHANGWGFYSRTFGSALARIEDHFSGTKNELLNAIAARFSCNESEDRDVLSEPCAFHMTKNPINRSVSQP
jgi:hypothetical protein